MLFTETTFIGIDPSAGQKPFAYAALDHELRLLALGEVNLNDVLAFAAGQHHAVIAVCAPRQPNMGVLARPDVRQNLSPTPHPGRWMDFRLVEYLLRQHNISIPQTYSQEQACPNWMKMGFQLHRRLGALGYQAYPHDGVPLQCLEIYPYACYAVLLGVLPFPKYTLEGRLQRQLVLHEHKLHIPDPMRFFEEITRHRLLKGILPTEDLYSSSELDALAGAYCAWLAASHPESVTLLGDTEEGQILLPSVDLQARYEAGPAS